MYELFKTACDLPPTERVSFLEQKCGEDVKLRDDVLLLLEADGRGNKETEADGSTLGFVANDTSNRQLEGGQALTTPIHTGWEIESPTPADDQTLPIDAPVRVEGYQIIREIARGGMGVVYEAIQTRLGRRVALKVLSLVPGGPNRDAVTRFRREANAAGKLHHTHIVPIYDFGSTVDCYYYAMELIEGQTLAEIVSRFETGGTTHVSRSKLAELVRNVAPGDAIDSPAADRGLDGSGIQSTKTAASRAYFRLVAQWMADAADALHYAHTQKIIHRDIKPGNLMLSKDGRIMVLDFGLAKGPVGESVTKTGALIGTLRYMSPEQAMAKRVRVDHRTDIFSLGATLYELLIFRPAFEGRDYKETLGLIISRDPTPPRKFDPHVPRELETICLKTLEKDPNARYETAAALADDLRRYIDDRPIVARPTGPIGKVTKYFRRHPWAAAALVGAFLGVAGAVIAINKDVKLAQSQREALEQRVEALVDAGTAHWQDAEWVEAEADFREALQLEPASARAMINFASMLSERFKAQRDPQYLEVANGLLNTALEIEPNRAPQIWNIIGVNLRLIGKYDEAIAAHKTAIELNGSYWANWASLAAAQAVAGDLKEAERSLQRAVQLEDGRTKIHPWLNLTAVQLTLRSPALGYSIEQLKTLSQRASGSTGVTGLVLLTRAKVHLLYKMMENPKQSLRLATSADTLLSAEKPNHLAKRILALAELRNDHLPEALEVANEAVAAGDIPSYPKLILAIALARLGDTDQAREHLDAALAAWPTDLEKSGFNATADQGYLWIETIAELKGLRDEAKAVLAEAAE